MKEEKPKSSKPKSTAPRSADAKTESAKDKQNNRNFIIAMVATVAIVGCLSLFLAGGKFSSEGNGGSDTPQQGEEENSVAMEDFDLAFLRTTQDETNRIYSPLSIKYALGMLRVGADGESKAQIDNILGSYIPKTYPNNEHMSFANAMFINEKSKSLIKADYVSALQAGYNAEVCYDSFNSAEPLNNWVSNKTFGLINKLFEDVSNYNYVLVNALAIDMEWVNKIQTEEFQGRYEVNYKHLEYADGIMPITITGYQQLQFENSAKPAKAVQIGATINRYDPIADLGEEKIRAEVGADYQKWLDDGAMNACMDYDTHQPIVERDVNKYLDQYIADLNENPKTAKASTDFSLYDDKSVKVFAKDLKTYEGTTLQYVAFMPKTGSLKDYVSKTNMSQLNNLISKLKPIEINSFEDGVITKISGNIPLFDYSTEINLVTELKELGVTDIFDAKKANLSNLTTEQASIDSAMHSAKIEFTNDGIKAAAVTAMGGIGGIGCGYDYFIKPKIKEINISFNRPFIYLIRDKQSGEVWFTGSVYHPSDWSVDDGGGVY